MEAVRLNGLIDSQIIVGEVTSEALQQFLGLYQYNAVSTTSCLISRLQLVRETLGNRSVEVASAVPTILRNERDLEQWVNNYFPEILPDILK